MSTAHLHKQNATIIVRGISTGHVKDTQPIKYIFRESGIGLSIGLIVATIVLIFINLIIPNSLIFSSIVALSLIANITSAAFIGASLPIIFNRLNIDPAVASAPFISTALDIISQLIYFSLTLYILTKIKLPL